jgi:hypothetical protein
MYSLGSVSAVCDGVGFAANQQLMHLGFASMVITATLQKKRDLLDY